MARPTDPANLDNAIQLYLAGESPKQIRATTGVSNTVLHRERIRRGIPPRRNLVLPDEQIAADYIAGDSELALGRRYGVSRNVIRLRLEAVGVPIRGRSQAGLVRVARMRPEQRKLQAEGAHRSWKPGGAVKPERKRIQPYVSRGKLVAEPTYIAADGGRKYTEEFLIARALHRERRRSNHSSGDRLMEDMLRDRGLDPVAQKAIGKYNVDVAVAPIAVEVLGGGWHMEKRHHAVRTPAILNEGWHLVFVWNREGGGALTAGAADYVISFLEEIRRQPPSIGEYRVIAGSGQLLSAGRADDDQFTLVPPSRGRQGRRA